jgi:hypothetical protein
MKMLLDLNAEVKILLVDFNAKVNILVEDFNAKVGREDIFKPTIWNRSLCNINNDVGVIVINFATSRNLKPKVQYSQIAAFINTASGREN